MPSNINPYNIDGTFPVANQDNPSQGFRDNFTNIKNNFLFAENEISDLQSKAVLTSALSGQSINNNMNGTQLNGPQLTAWTQSITDLGDIATTAVLDFSMANFQKLTIYQFATNINLQFINWPATTGQGAQGYGVMRIWLTTTVPYQTVTLPASVNIANASLPYYQNNVLTFDVPNQYIFDISSIDGGANYMIQELTRNRAWFVDPDFYYNPTVAPSLFVGYGNLLPIAQTVETSAADAISAFGSLSSYQSAQNFGGAFGNGDGAAAGGSSVNTPGFGVNVSRSYVDSTLGTVIKGVNSNDALGYFNTSMAAGSPGDFGNTSLPEAGTMRMYATSSLPTYVTSLPDGYGGVMENYSPGGNIQFWTKQDYGILGANTLGTIGWPRSDSVNQSGNGGVLGLAATIENDQSFKTWGATARNYAFSNLSMITGNITVNVSPYISTVILDSTNGATVSKANLLLAPGVALHDGQELNISTNCAITTLSIVPYTGNVVVPVNKYAVAAGLDGSTITYYFDNSGGVFSTGGYFQASGFASVAGFNGTFGPIISYDTLSANVAGTVTGYDESGGVVSSTTNFNGNTKIAANITSATAGSSIKLMYVATQNKWYRV